MLVYKLIVVGCRLVRHANVEGGKMTFANSRVLSRPKVLE